MAKVVKILCFIRKAPDSHLGQDTWYPDRSLSWFSSPSTRTSLLDRFVHLENFHNTTSNKLQAYKSKFATVCTKIFGTQINVAIQSYTENKKVLFGYQLRDEMVFHSQLSCAFVSRAAKWKNKHCLLIFNSDISFKNK